MCYLSTVSALPMYVPTYLPRYLSYLAPSRGTPFPFRYPAVGSFPPLSLIPRRLPKKPHDGPSFRKDHIVLLPLALRQSRFETRAKMKTTIPHMTIPSTV